MFFNIGPWKAFLTFVTYEWAQSARVFVIITEGCVSWQFKGHAGDEVGHVNVQPKNSKVVFNDGWYVKILAAVL